MTKNPWLLIPANEYDRHLSHSAVRQREFLDAVFAQMLKELKPRSIALLGCATGGGLEYVNAHETGKVTAVDLNPIYLQVTHARHAGKLPQLELVEGDIHSCELESGEYDLIHCALILEYVDTAVVLRKIARWLAPGGVLVVVLQLASPDMKTVTETECESLKLLEPLMTLHEPEKIRSTAAQVNLVEGQSQTVQLATGKRFYVGQFTSVVSGEEH